jgi:hypothetical protein
VTVTVYEPTLAEGYQWVLPVDDSDFEVLRSLSAEREAVRRRPVRVRLLKADEEGHLLEEADMPWLGSHALVLGKRAVEILGELIAADVDLLPLECGDAEHCVVHVRRIVDARIMNDLRWCDFRARDGS